MSNGWTFGLWRAVFVGLKKSGNRSLESTHALSFRTTDVLTDFTTPTVLIWIELLSPLKNKLAEPDPEAQSRYIYRIL